MRCEKKLCGLKGKSNCGLLKVSGEVILWIVIDILVGHLSALSAQSNMGCKCSVTPWTHHRCITLTFTLPSESPSQTHWTRGWTMQWLVVRVNSFSVTSASCWSTTWTPQGKYMARDPEHTWTLFSSPVTFNSHFVAASYQYDLSWQVSALRHASLRICSP